jgi:hypothetical protein
MSRLLAGLIILCCSHFGLAGQPVEEIAAVVGATPILHSDLELARIVHLLEPTAEEELEAYHARLLDARIRIELQYRNLEESGTLFRLELDLNRAVQTLADRAGGEEVLHGRLGQVGLKMDDLEELALRVAAVQAYVEERLRARITVTLEDVEAAYQQLKAEIEASGETAPPLAAVRDQLHRLVVERKLNWEIERWLEQARERQPVTRFHR